MKHCTAAMIVSLLSAWSCQVMGFAPSSRMNSSSMIASSSSSSSSINGHSRSNSRSNSQQHPSGSTVAVIKNGARTCTDSTTTLLSSQKSTASQSNNQSNNQSSSNKKRSNADFEYQEMRAILAAMEQRNIQTLEPVKRTELESYITKVVQQRIPPQPVPLTVPNLINTKYRLAFSNQAITATSLPTGAAVLLEFTSNTTLQYRLQFSESNSLFGLQNMNAQCTYTLNEETGLLQFVYDRITTDLFGLQNLPVGLFGQLKGRTSYIVSSYYDGDYWIEVAYDSPQRTSTYTNVYVRVK